MASKKAMEKFAKDINKYLISIGAEKIENYSTCANGYKLNTTAGLLHITVPVKEASQVFTIFTRFEDEKMAATVLRKHTLNFNKYSGKYNFHYYSHDECQCEFVEAISDILLPALAT